MKITRRQLRRIIKEELSLLREDSMQKFIRMAKEQGVDDNTATDTDDSAVKPEVASFLAAFPGALAVYSSSPDLRPMFNSLHAQGEEVLRDYIEAQLADFRGFISRAEDLASDVVDPLGLYAAAYDYVADKVND